MEDINSIVRQYKNGAEKAMGQQSLMTEEKLFLYNNTHKVTANFPDTDTRRLTDYLQIGRQFTSTLSDI